MANQGQSHTGVLGKFIALFGGVGCLGCLGIVAFIVVCIGGALFLGSNIFKSSEVAQEALARARADPTVVEELGAPIEMGWFVTGSISTQGLSGDADLVIPIAGPKKSGTLYASARRSDGVWQFYTLSVVIDGRPGIIQMPK